ncbi:endolytic transglycosylase MltG, partial [bacterium]|nr:endolytic transglycosylase MltG [bacterium]
SYDEVQIQVVPGTAINTIINKLHSKGVIRYKILFKLYIYLKNADGKVRAGDYKFESGLSPSDIIQRLLKGDFQTHRLQVLEGWTYRQIAHYLALLPFVKNENFEEEFIKLCEYRPFISSLGFVEEETLEGYLFPNTYEVYELNDPRDIIKIMVSEFKKRFTDEMEKRAEELGMNRDKILTLASIIEKETSIPEERNLISSVFHNRLKIKMALQSDPTVIYGIKDFNGNLTKKDLQLNHPYNTYVRPGLPPGPICNPGLESIKAALWPAKSNYLYFVSKNDGSHHFSKSLSEHNRAVWQYQINQQKP